MTKGGIIRITCQRCGQQFRPYGSAKIERAPMYAIYKCPNCSYENHFVFDEQLTREVLRKKLGLDKKFEDEMQRIKLENQELKIEIVWLKKQVENNIEAIKALEIRMGKRLSETKKELAQEITKIIGQRTKKKPTFKPI